MQTDIIFSEEDRERQAWRLERKGDLETANRLYTELLEEYPETARLYHRRGKNKFHKKEYSKALEDFDLAIKYCKTKPEYYGSRGVIHLKQKRYSEAERDLRYASYLSKGKLTFNWYLGNLYYDLGEYKEAVQKLKGAIYCKEPFKVYKVLALCYFKLNDYPNALSSLMLAEVELPNDHWVQFSIGRCYYMFASKEVDLVIGEMLKEGHDWLKFHNDSEKKWWLEAVKYLNKSIELDNSYAYGYWMRGKCLQTLGKPKEADEDFSMAISLKPDQIEFYKDWDDNIELSGDDFFNPKV